MADLQNWIRHGDEIRRPLLANSDLPKAEKIVIVGGGLSGLCCALRIAEKRPDLPILLVEKSAELGGVIATWQEDEWICDLAVNATRPHPAFWRLIDDLQLSDKFQTSNQKAKSRWILLGDKQHKLSPFSLFKIGPFKLRKALKLVKNGGYSVADLMPHKQIADALTLGIVNDTASNVDADFLMPSVTKFGENPPVKKSKLTSLIAKSYPLFTPKKGTIASLDGGMITLTKALIERLRNMSNVEIRLNYNAQSPKSVATENNVPLSSIIWSAPGLKDGSNAAVNVLAFKSPDDVNWRSATDKFGTVAPGLFSNAPLKPDDKIMVITANGAGYGDPFERDPHAVLTDFLDDLLSSEQAETFFKVVISKEKVDAAATAELRRGSKSKDEGVLS